MHTHMHARAAPPPPHTHTFTPTHTSHTHTLTHALPCCYCPQDWFHANKDWLQPYAAFVFLRELFGSAEHWTWGTLAKPTSEVGGHGAPWPSRSQRWVGALGWAGLVLSEGNNL